MFSPESIVSVGRATALSLLLLAVVVTQMMIVAPSSSSPRQLLSAAAVLRRRQGPDVRPTSSLLRPAEDDVSYISNLEALILDLVAKSVLRCGNEAEQQLRSAGKWGGEMMVY